MNTFFLNIKFKKFDDILCLRYKTGIKVVRLEFPEGYVSLFTFLCLLARKLL